jgi:S1-C subfamily serine protease
MRSTSVRRLAAATAVACFLARPAPPASADDQPSTPTTSAPVPTPVDEDPEALALALSAEESLVKAVAAVRAASVAVFNYQSRAFPGNPAPKEPTLTGQGSGVVYAASGKAFVITNEHVVKDAARIRVRMSDGASYEVARKDQVPQYDIALLEFVDDWQDAKPVEAKPPSKEVKERLKALKSAKIGNSRRATNANPAGLTEGQWVFATGNPFFLGSDGTPVATLGVISGLDRILGGEFEYANAIQHDAEVNPGNSGGPLWTLKGELVGINGKIATRGDGASASASNTGASFAVPIHLIQRYLPALLNDDVAAAPGYLGLTCESATDPKGQPGGARVQRIANDCPCARRGAGTGETGIALGDVIEKISVLSGTTATYEVKSASDYVNAMALLVAGTKVRVSFARGTKKLSWVGALIAAKGGK